MAEKRLQIKVYGIVQGVGFRPFIDRLAEKYELCGSVCNRGSYVDIIAQADDVVLKEFIVSIEEEAPKSSLIVKIKSEEMPLEDSFERVLGEKEKKFKIIESEKEKGLVFVSPDLATCADCERELYDKNDRRYLHPFINCTNCGPRLTILDSMPYDRERTSMEGFPMCKLCEREYKTSVNRRYHAQPVCCHDDGPELYIIDKEGKRLELGENKRKSDDAAIKYSRGLLAYGGILAIKGIGGFHLACDAANEAAVSRLRNLKNRPVKPFAVMMKDIDVIRRECSVTEQEEKVLTGMQKPIALLRKSRNGEAMIAKSVAPSNPNIGVMLPYTPLHMLLFRYPVDENTGDEVMPDALVMTSGNPSGAPICMDDDAAIRYLTPMCDAILSNNRKIRIRTDDSVMSYYQDKPYMIRRSRGYAPLPIILPFSGRKRVLAVGAELKNTFCLAEEDLYYPSSYIGDMLDMRSVKAHEAAVIRMENLLEIEPDIIACDMHPGYNTSHIAKSFAKKIDDSALSKSDAETGEGANMSLIEVQHHHAHIVSCMAENGYMDDVIGMAFDGTGYGIDGTIWGGEFLRAGIKDFERLGSISPFEHIGGDVASREGWRIAASILPGEIAMMLGICNSKELKTLRAMSENRINVVESTSAGRLFDAASALLDLCKKSSFEGEAAMKLQFAAERALSTGKAINSAGSLGLIRSSTGFTLATNQLLINMAELRLDGADSEALALFFHEELARMILEGCELSRELTGLNTVALSGGVFQNLLLLRLTDELLAENGFTVLKHSLIPPNDGGLCLGQAVVAMARTNNK